MSKKKKIILISVIAIVVICLIAISIYYLTTNNGEKSNNENSKISKLYEKLQSKDAFSFEITLDDNNKMFYAKSGDIAYTDTWYNGEESKYLIKDGNSYLLVDDIKTYYTYSNNSIDLNKVLLELSKVKDLEHQEGKEKINNKNYDYEEYTILTDFAMGDFTEDSEEVKTRFYFDGEDLVYIKTIEGEKQETLKVNVSYDVDNNLFELPSDYRAL